MILPPLLCDYATNHSGLAAKIFMSVGALDVLEPEAAAMVANMQVLAKVLRSRSFTSLDLSTCVFEYEAMRRTYR